MNEIYFGDGSYPALLAEISKPPKKIFVLGNAEQLADAQQKPIIAIVGTRRPTQYGKEVAYTLARDLALRGVVVVSGLALGIDAAAHKGALEGGGKTWAVLGSGIDNIQPVYNRKLAEDIIRAQGLIISEYPGSTDATKWTFPERNRIVAGLSSAVIVVEAPIRSGALITARLALDANREVGAVPGEVFSVQSGGTHMLLREGAAVIRDANDILELVGVATLGDETKVDKLDDIAQNILHSLNVPKTVDEIAHAVGKNTAVLGEYLSSLEIEGIIENKGGVFHKINL